MDGQRDPTRRLFYTVSSLEYAEGGDEKELYSEEGGEQTRRAHSAHLALGQGPWGPAESPPCPAVRALYGRGDERVREATAQPHGPGAQSWPGARALKLL